MRIKKRIIIVNNNLKIGGIQKSLINLLASISDEYDITLVLFCLKGSYIDEIPKSVNIVVPSRLSQLLGMDKKDLITHPILCAIKVVFKVIAYIFGRDIAFKLFFKKMPFYRGFDAAISYSHLPSKNSFSVGTAEFVLNKIDANKKICMIHCDYKNSGYASDYNDRIYSKFDALACCSESVMNTFCMVSPGLSDKTCVLYNFFNLSITKKANEEIKEDLISSSFINIIVVGRLSVEKAHIEGIKALLESRRNDIRLYIVGDGPTKSSIKKFIKNNNLESFVFLLGNKNNPYPYFVCADYLMLNSMHEASPIVFDEAKILGIPVISSNTISAHEKLDCNVDIIYENTNELVQVFKEIGKSKKLNNNYNNEKQMIQFAKIIE